MITEKQKKDRLNGIGASDIPIIAGYSSYMTAYELWMIKRGEIEQPEAGEAAKWGNRMEDVIAEMYTERTGNKVRRSNTTQWHRNIPFMFTHLDRTVVGDAHPLEIKNTIKSQEWGDEKDGPEGIPSAVNLQVQHQMEVVASDYSEVAACFFGNKLKIYGIPRDQDLIDMIIELERNFWDQVQSGEYPNLDNNHKTTISLLKRLYPGTNGETVSFPACITHWHEVLVEAKGHVKAYESVVNSAKNHILHVMGDNAVGKLEDGTAYTRKIVKRKAFSVEAASYIDFKYTKKPPKQEKE